MTSKTPRKITEGARRALLAEWARPLLTRARQALAQADTTIASRAAHRAPRVRDAMVEARAWISEGHDGLAAAIERAAATGRLEIVEPQISVFAGVCAMVELNSMLRKA